MDDTSPSDASTHRQDRRLIEAELFSLEADRTHLTRRRDDMVTQIQGLHHKVKQLESQIDDATAQRASFDSKLVEVDQTIQRTKKKLRLL